MFALTERQKVAHLLRRFGLGASEAEVDYYGRNGYREAVERLLDPTAIPEPYEIDIESLRNEKDNLRMGTVVAWWGHRILTTRRPLLERMTIHWHDHFATGADKVKAALSMHGQNETLRKHALGKFRDLLGAISQDPAMLVYLDNQQNVKGKPNENFARELMELFTLGIGHYSEEDVREAARAFTGYSLGRVDGRPGFIYRAALHDDGEKTFLGKTGPITGNGVLDQLCAHPQTADFLVRKLWIRFVSPDPAPATLSPFIKAFYESNLDIEVLLRAIMLSDEFVSERVFRRSVKSPVDTCLVTLRQMGVGEIVGKAGEMGATKPARNRVGVPAMAANAMRSQGMWLLYPPDVSGWKPGEAWITTATMVERISWAGRLFGTAAKGNLPGRYPAYLLLKADPTPTGIVDKLLSTFDAPIAPSKREALIGVAKTAIGTGLTPQNANAVAAGITRLIFGLPEFQMA